MSKPEHATPLQQSPNCVAPQATVSAAISTPHIHDVLCERGRMANGHPGNLYFRLVIGEHKRSYVMNGTNGAHEAVKAVKSLVPPGRFLKRCGDFWFEVDHKKALEKARQCLSEGRPQLYQILAAERDETDRIGPNTPPLDLIPSARVSLSMETSACSKRVKKNPAIACSSFSEPEHHVPPNVPTCPSFIPAPSLDIPNLCPQQVPSWPTHYPLGSVCASSVYSLAGEEGNEAHPSKLEIERSSGERSNHWMVENTTTVAAKTTESNLVRLTSAEYPKKCCYESDRSKMTNSSSNDDNDMQTSDVSYEPEWLNLIDCVQPTDICDLNRWPSDGVRSDISDELQALDLNSDLASKISHQHLAWNSDSSRTQPKSLS